MELLGSSDSDSHEKLSHYSSESSKTSEIINSNATPKYQESSNHREKLSSNRSSSIEKTPLKDFEKADSSISITKKQPTPTPENPMNKSADFLENRVKQSTKKLPKNSSIYIFDEDPKKFLEKIENNRKFFENSSFQDPSSALRLFLTKFKFSFTSQDLESFDQELKLADQFSLKVTETGRKPVFRYENFKKACFSWFLFSKTPNLFRQKLIQSLSEFSNLKQLAKSEQESTFIGEIIEKCLAQLDLIEKTVISEENPEKTSENSEKLIKKVFKFYVQQIRGTSKKSSIESLDQDLNFLTFSKFLFFCKDFKLLKPRKNPKKTSEQIQYFQEIFQKTTNFSKKMNQDQFKKALLELSKNFIEKTTDNEENLNRFLQYLGINQKLQNKLDQIKRNLVKDSRISENDLSKKFKLDVVKMKKMKDLIQDWKGKKKQSASFDGFIETGEEKRNQNTKITFELLKKARKEDFDLSELIQEQSSDEELYSKLEKKNKVNLNQSISNKILIRAQELGTFQQKQEEKKVEDILKGSSKYFTRIFKYSKK